METTDKQTFSWFPFMTDILANTPDEVFKEFVMAVCNYGTYGTEPEFSNPFLSMAFEGIRKDIDNSLNARGKNKGGRPKKNQEENGGSYQTKTKETPVSEVSPLKEEEKTSETPVSGLETGFSEIKTSENLETPVTEFQKSENPSLYTKPNQTIPNQAKPKDIDSPVIAEIVDYLNEKANTSYRSSSKNTKAHIRARLKEGFTVQDFKTVIDGRIKAWAKDQRMCEYIRPDTLFGSKFESYLNAEKVGNCTSQGGDGLDEVFEEYGKIYDERAISIEELDRMAVAN